MIWIPYLHSTCPHCNSSLDVNILHISTMHGPTAVVCDKCGRIVGTDRVEWAQMSTRHKALFVCVSCFYGALAFIFGGISLSSGIELLKTGHSGPSDWMNFDPIFCLGGGIAVLFVLAVQIFRVRASLDRTNRSDLVPRYTLLSFDFYGQTKAVLVIFLFTWTAWAITRFPPYRNPQVSDLLVILFFFFLAGLVVYRGTRRPRDLAKENAAAEKQNAIELFELLTRDLDSTKPLRWVYTLKTNSLPGTIESVRNELRAMGFSAETRRDDQDPQLIQFEVSERQEYTSVTFASRFAEVDRFAKTHSMEVADCVASDTL